MTGASCPTRSGISQADCVDFYLAHTDFINNWDLVDLSCYPLLGVWLLDKDRSLLYGLARKGKTLWEQRIGIVSTMTFIRHGQLDDTFAIADILLHHPHDLIHKAVGWLLREAPLRHREVHGGRTPLLPAALTSLAAHFFGCLRSAVLFFAATDAVDYHAVIKIDPLGF